MKNEQNPMFGRKHSEQTIEKFKKDRHGQHCGDENPMFGRKHSLSAKQKVSESRKGKIWIYKGMVTKSVPAEELDMYQKAGWARGRALDKRLVKKYIDQFLPIDIG